MTVPYTFATATSAIPLSNLDSNFATAITIGSTAVYLGNTTTTIAGLTLSSPTLTTPALGTPSSGTLTNCTGYPGSAISGTISLTTQVTGTLPVANGGTGVTTSTGSGNVVLSTSPTLVTPILGTPTSATLTNATGLPISTGVSGLGTGVATFLATPSSANLATAVTDETGSGSLVFATSPTLVTPILGTPTSGTLTNTTGFPAANLAGTALPAAIVTSSLTAVGTIATGVWNGTAIAIANGGTGQTTKSAAFNALSPITTTGDLIIGNGSNSATRLAIGANTYVLTSDGTTASWQAASSGGTQATATALGTVYAKQTTSGASPYLTAFGYNAGVSTTGVSNTAVGTQALFSNTTASNNTAVGYQALYLNTENNNTAIGHQACMNGTAAYENSALGYRAMYSVTFGFSNVAMGKESLASITTGSDNVAIGHWAGYYNYGSGVATLTGTGNVFIGTSAMGSGSAITSEIVIGASAVGKGTSTGFISPGGGAVYQGNNSATWSVASDQRLKKNIVDNNVGLDKVTQIQVRNFEYRTQDEITDLPKDQAIKKEGVQLGAIAQELQQVLPDCVKTESTGVMSVDTTNIIWHLINAVKELSSELNALKTKVGA